MLACGLMLLGGDRHRQCAGRPGTAHAGGADDRQGQGRQGIHRHVHDREASSPRAASSTPSAPSRASSAPRRSPRTTSRLPAAVANATAPAKAAQVPPLPLPPLPAGNACSILSLDLGPINLNLLGLVVRTNQIQLRIDAVQGPGNLLGNLLCGITGILNPSGTLANTPLGQLAQILNALLALSPRTA